MNVTSQQDAAALYLHSPEEIAHRLRAMQHQESTAYRPVDYLANRRNYSSSFNEEHRLVRSRMCDWCHQLVDATSLSCLSVSRSMGYLD